MNKRQQIREKQRRSQRNRRIFSIAAVAVIAVAVVGLLILTNIPKPIGNIVTPEVRSHPQADFNHLGDPNAPVKIIEYSDYQCPFCANYWKQTEAAVIDTYVKAGKVYYTDRSMGNFISDNLNRQAGTTNHESADASQAAYCAGDQGKFWDYHDLLFANQQPENSGALDRNHLDAYAQKLGLNMGAFDSCLNGQKYAAMVTQDGVDGQKAITSAPNYDGKGVGTPSFLVNGRLINGAQPISAFQKEIDAALASAGK